ncbi:MAG: aminotransferase class I/II-fold pyridoxal phosphate-dependent enzyme [Truepera sp.]|nr:aminotransferase class I/II-fold pyridoxal phosphate-dependent enzyme [Truepera sp.]
MPFDRVTRALQAHLDDLIVKGTAKGSESVITAVLPAQGERGPRYLVAGEGERPFIKLNANSYLGLALHPALIEAEEEAVRRYGVGPGAVRFISGTHAPHVALEERLAAFHQREAGIIFSSAYAAVVSVLVPLISADTAVISDELNHNCIINAIRLARPKAKFVYRHLDLADLETKLAEAATTGSKRVIIVTDGIFSMRGVHAPLAEIVALAHRFDAQFPENAIVIVDDSHGVGAFGATGRGTEEYTGAEGVDILVATLGKAFGVNGGYAVGSRTLVQFLRETAMMYIYSNPITPGEAAAALAALRLLDSPAGLERLAHLRTMTGRFKDGLTQLGFETLPGEHPVVPLMVRDTARTAALVTYLRRHGVLATGLNFPVVPRGDESIRFQVNADHTPHDIGEVLAVLADFR